MYFSFDAAVYEQRWTTDNDGCSPTELVDMNMNCSEIGDDVSRTYRSGLVIFSYITIHFQLNKIKMKRREQEIEK